jgi:hypothetical protein
VVAVELDVPALGARGVNAALRELPPGSSAVLRNPGGAHNLAVGLDAELNVLVDGPAGYYTGGLGKLAQITVAGPTGWGAGENLMSGTVRVRGDASQSAAASAEELIRSVPGRHLEQAEVPAEPPAEAMLMARNR